MNEKLLEPLKYYNDELRNLHIKNIEEYFDDLVKKSNINVEENRETVKKYKDKIEEVNNIDKKLKKFGIIRTILIILISGFGIASCYEIYHTYQFGKYDSHYLIKGIILCIVFAAIVAGSIYFLIKKVNPIIKDSTSIKAELENEAGNIQNKCFEQMAPLNRLFDSDDTRQIIMKTMPDIVIDKNFDMERFEYLYEKYGINENSNVDISTLKILSGEIVGNPYIVNKFLSHVLGEYTYTGELVITWETYSYDSDGNRITHHHTQTLRASLTKPKPYYYEYTTMIYGNEAAPNLSFSRKPNHIEKKSEKEIAKIVKKGSKEIQKMSKEALKNGSNFTALGNDEFDVLFGATDRDNETEFRLLFTPLAQKNEIDILKNSPYGDDFEFIKENQLNYLTGENSVNWDLDTNGHRFSNYDIDDSRERFRSFQIQYFDHFYFQIAPILAIPLYQQHKPAEYIYQHKFARNYTSYQTEVMANIMGESCFADNQTQTRAILKTHYYGSDGNTDNVSVTAYSYDAIPRTDYVSVYGGDGYYHDVPVNWTEYIPLQKTSAVKIKNINITDDKFAEISYKNEFNKFMSDHFANGYSFQNGMFAMKVNDDRLNSMIDNDINELIKTFDK